MGSGECFDLGQCRAAGDRLEHGCVEQQAVQAGGVPGFGIELAERAGDRQADVDGRETRRGR